MANQRRVFKIGEKIQGIIASELQRVADPRFSLVTITSVLVSSDMRSAKVYWTVCDDSADRRKEVEQAFEGAQGLFRKAIARELSVRFIPVLKFFYDDTLDVSAEVDKLFARIAKPSQELDEGSGDAAYEDESST